MTSILSSTISTAASSVFATANARKAVIGGSSSADGGRDALGRAMVPSAFGIRSGNASDVMGLGADAEAFASATVEMYDRVTDLMGIMRAQQEGILRSFGLEVNLGDVPLRAEAERAASEVTAAYAAVASDPSAAEETPAEPGVVETATDHFIWTLGDALPDFSGALQFGGAMTISASVQFDDLAAGGWQRVFDFGNGEDADNVVLGQVGTSSDMTFQIHQGGLDYVVTAQNAIIEGESAVWTARVDEIGGMSIFKNGLLLAYSGGLLGSALATVDRGSNFIGSSNWAGHEPLHGTVHSVEVAHGAWTNTEVADFAAGGGILV